MRLPTRTRSRRRQLAGRLVRLGAAWPAFRIARSALRPRAALVTVAAAAVLVAVAVWWRRSGSPSATDLPVGPAPSYGGQEPVAADADASPANPETELPEAPDGAPALDVDAPNEGAAGHEPATA